MMTTTLWIAGIWIVIGAIVGPLITTVVHSFVDSLPAVPTFRWWLITLVAWPLLILGILMAAGLLLFVMLIGL